MKLTIDFEKKTVSVHENVSAKDLYDRLIQVFGVEGLSDVVIEKMTKEVVRIEKVIEVVRDKAFIRPIPLWENPFTYEPRCPVFVGDSPLPFTLTSKPEPEHKYNNFKVTCKGSEGDLTKLYLTHALADEITTLR